MKHQRGFTLVEMAVGLGIVSLISVAAAGTVYQVLNGSQRSNDHMAAVRQVQNAGYWISRDARVAQSAATENLTFPNFLVLTWAEQDFAGGGLVHHSVTYFFDNTDGPLGELKRAHWSSAGVNEENLVATGIYYDPSDTENTSRATYAAPVLTANLTAASGAATEKRQYRAQHRPNL